MANYLSKSEFSKLLWEIMNRSLLEKERFEILKDGTCSSLMWFKDGCLVQRYLKSTTIYEDGLVLFGETYFNGDKIIENKLFDGKTLEMYYSYQREEKFVK